MQGLKMETQLLFDEKKNTSGMGPPRMFRTSGFDFNHGDLLNMQLVQVNLLLQISAS